jgi:hypothetical protein
MFGIEIGFHIGWSDLKGPTEGLVGQGLILMSERLRLAYPVVRENPTSAIANATARNEIMAKEDRVTDWGTG